MLAGAFLLPAALGLIWALGNHRFGRPAASAPAADVTLTRIR